MYRKLWVGMGAILGLLTCAAAAKAQGPQFSQVKQIGASSSIGPVNALYTAGSGTNPALFQGFNYAVPSGATYNFTLFQNQSAPGQAFNPITVKIVKSTATYQQVYLTAKGEAAFATPNTNPWPSTPVKLQIFITLGSKPSSYLGAGSKVAIMSFTAVNAAGQKVFASGPMTGAWK